MWVVSDDDMRKLLGGEFVEVILAKQIDKDISVRKLYRYQFDYDSYNGFRKFFNKKLRPIISSVKYVDEYSFVGRVLRWVTQRIKIY